MPRDRDHENGETGWLRRGVVSGVVRLFTSDAVRSSSNAVKMLRSGRGSSVYRWFTADTEGKSVVVDLEETYVVRVPLNLLGTSVDGVYPHWRRSRVRRVARTVGGGLSRRVRFGGVERITAPLEPPELSTDGTDRGPEETNRASDESPDDPDIELERDTDDGTGDP